MTRDQIKEEIKEMDCLERFEIEALADLIYQANERKVDYTGTDAYKKAAAVIDWLYEADRITLINKLDMRELLL